MTTPPASNSNRLAIRALMLAAYIIFVVISMVSASRYQVRLIATFRPNLAQFQNTVHFSTVLLENKNRKGGVTLLIDGHELACGSSYLGSSSNCRGELRTLNGGTPLTADVALIRCFSGEFWVARAIALGDGSSYTTTPEQMMQQWERASQALIPQVNLFLAAAFFGLPLLFALVFRLAARLPPAEPRAAKVRVIDGSKPWG
jgi:hypothetical protein